MGDYESGYDPKYGYNRNAFAHKTIPQAIIGRVVKLIALPIGLASEVYHNEIDKQRRSDSRVNALSAAEAKISTTFGETANQEVASPSGGKSDDSPPVYVEVPEDQAEELIASYQAVPADDKTATHELVPQHSEDDGVECDEADWALDEAASETEDKSDSKDDPEADREEPTGQEKLQSTPTKEVKVDSRTKKVPSQKIPFPVILPQRRPGTKARGFVRAYAPVLQDAGIDQDAFISFLKNFHKAAQASPIFDVIMIATGIASMFPDLVVDLSIQAAEIAIGIAQEVQKRWRTNKFLDQANRDIFIPKGLFALIVTYKTNDNQNTEIGTKTVDLGASAMVKYGDALALPEDAMSTEGKQQIKQTKLDEMKAKVKQFRISSGETRGEAELPVTCAPLVFPALDAFADANEPKANEGVANSIITKSKSASKFVNDYFDRRAQASYVSLMLRSLRPSSLWSLGGFL